MIKGLGIDISELSRFEKAIETGDAFANKVLTKAELKKYNSLTGNSQVRFLAGRFSVKEAFAKALGTGIGAGVSFSEIETLNDEQGKPVTTSPKFNGNIWTSISHSDEYIISEVILEEI